MSHLVQRLLFTALLMSFAVGQSPTCRKDQFWNSQRCVDCASEGCQCSVAEGCSSCWERFVMASGSCHRCPDQCTSCSEDLSMCTACSDYAMLIDGVCVRVSSFGLRYSGSSLSISGCKSIDQSSFRCTTCDTGRMLDTQGVCVYCTQNCKTCSHSSQCDQCMDGYFISDYSANCEECGPNCNQCSAPNVCTGCFKGSVLIDSRCEICDTEGTGSIGSSGPGSSGPGSSGGEDPVCIACGSDKVCTQCNPSYFHPLKLVNGDCKTCREIFPGCETCNADLSACTLCWTEKYLTAGGQCSDCGGNQMYCKLDGSNLIPIQCNNGFILHTPTAGSKMCQINDKKCLTTTPNTDYACASCSPSMQLVNKECKTCSSGCMTCTFSDAGLETCTKCQNDVYQTLTLGSCVFNPLNPTTCQHPGYRVPVAAVDTTTSCVKCPNYCAKCSRTACTACNAGYTLFGGTCYKEKEYCLNRTAGAISETQGNCETCIKGFRSVNGFCRKCFSFTQGLQCNVTAGFPQDYIDDCTSDNRGSIYLVNIVAALFLILLH